ncbi:MAG: hypothetical protein QOJ26_492 [Thermoplasmata archaeon]|jgi:hypothetical protein|nr:hypothetical protein [Thermoplasmata archaeon]MEA3165626.1 hypothetical protein [Thermoplasmata archaeon]
MHDHGGTILLIALAGLLSLVLTLLAAGAWHRTGNRKLAFVTAAFWMSFVKSTLTAYSLWSDFIGHEHLELVGAMFDVAIVLLLVAPFLAASPRAAPA